MGGRKRYEEWLGEDRLVQLSDWVRDGLSQVEIARRVGVNKRTLWEWKRLHPAIARALKGRELGEIEVERALLRAACGYEYQEVTREPVRDPDGEPLLEQDGTPRTRIVRVVTKYARPSLSAASFWLKHRGAALWWHDPELQAGERESSNLLEAIRAAAPGAFARIPGEAEDEGGPGPEGGLDT